MRYTCLNDAKKAIIDPIFSFKNILFRDNLYKSNSVLPLHSEFERPKNGSSKLEGS